MYSSDYRVVYKHSMHCLNRRGVRTGSTLVYILPKNNPLIFFLFFSTVFFLLDRVNYGAGSKWSYRNVKLIVPAFSVLSLTMKFEGGFLDRGKIYTPKNKTPVRSCYRTRFKLPKPCKFTIKRRFSGARCKWLTGVMAIYGLSWQCTQSNNEALLQAVIPLPVCMKLLYAADILAISELLEADYGE